MLSDLIRPSKINVSFQNSQDKVRNHFNFQETTTIVLGLLKNTGCESFVFAKWTTLSSPSCILLYTLFVATKAVNVVWL